MVTTFEQHPCPYCGCIFTQDVQASVEHLQVHRVLRHKVLPGMYQHNIGLPSAVNRIQIIFGLLLLTMARPRHVGLAEILEKMKFCTWNFASYVFGSKIQV